MTLQSLLVHACNLRAEEVKLEGLGEVSLSYSFSYSLSSKLHMNTDWLPMRLCLKRQDKNRTMCLSFMTLVSEACHPGNDCRIREELGLSLEEVLL